MIKIDASMTSVGHMTTVVLRGTNDRYPVCKSSNHDLPGDRAPKIGLCSFKWYNKNTCAVDALVILYFFQSMSYELSRLGNLISVRDNVICIEAQWFYQLNKYQIRRIRYKYRITFLRYYYIVSLPLYLSLYTYIYIYIYVCVYLNVYICVYLCMCVGMVGVGGCV